MLLTMFVSLYTVRIVLETLGEIDYGIYNVVGGIVTMFSFLSSSMAVASQRFFAFELGTKNQKQIKKIFSITMSIYIIIAIVILILAETLGLWFLKTQMNITPERMESAHWVYQFSIFSFMMTIFSIPYNSSVIAHEQMNVYAWGSIIEIILKLLIVYILVVFSFDKLKLYSILMFIVTTITTSFYRIYCKYKYEECRFYFCWDISLFKTIISYSSWNLIGALANVFNNQGANIILNIFFGPIVNTARGIAYQVNGAIMQFVQNFMTASRPQIIKYYAENEKEKMLNLIFQSSKLSFLLLFILTVPFLLKTDYILEIWLKEIPKYVVIFTQLVILSALIDSLSFPLMTAAQATGKIKNYTIIVGSVMLLNLPISYVFFKLNYPPPTIFFLAIINSIICLYLRLILLKKMIKFPIKKYFREVIFPLLSTIVLTYAILIPITGKLKDYTFTHFFIVFLIGLCISSLLSYTLGFSQAEKYQSKKYIKKIVQKYVCKKN